MFVIILALQENGVTERIGAILGEDRTVFRYGAASFLAANLINNIPMSVLFCPVIRPLAGSASDAVLRRAVYATVVGSNLGAYLTPIGALAGIMWMSLLKKHEVKFGYLDFIKYGALVSVPTLLAVLSILALTI
jgi:arsenical pump membrane protein